MEYRKKVNEIFSDENSVKIIDQSDARRRIVVTAAAICRYRAKHGRLPQTLDELTPEQLVFVPKDPFDGEPLKLRKTDDGLMIYSIGPDMTDNGGQPFDRKTREGDMTFTLRKPSP